ncbi:MAG: alanine--tRNA ligase, partial [Epulopiscium sp. Nele67-Bin002]
TVYKDDKEAAKIWHNDIGVPKDKIFYMGKEDNFWEVGTVGPCGPCSEIYYDRGEEFGCGLPDCTIGCDCDRYIEFWNLVFTQFDKNEDGSYTPLPNPNIDTGMGLERLAAMMQGVRTLFDVDTVKAIRDHVCELAGVTYGADAKTDVSVRVITDHIRSVVFMSSDGVRASNEGRGYVMRRLLRRAVRHGKMLGIEGLFLEPLIRTVVEHSKSEYNELEEKYDYIVKSLTVEEQNFNQTIEQGLNILDGYIAQLEKGSSKVLDGAACFKLYDTFGFPIDLTREILEEKGFTIDEDEFSKEMNLQRERARNSHSETSYMGADETIFNRLDTNITSEFVGYTHKELTSNIDFITTNDEILDTVSGGDVFIITSKTPFYAESGGQAGDFGLIVTDTGKAKVTNTTKVAGAKIAHHATVLEGSISVGQSATLIVDMKAHLDIARNHSATHVLQKALRDVVGSHIEQAGSNVSKDRLRFDYTHFEALTSEQIGEVENLVNEKILEGLDIEIMETSIEDAKKMGAIALFGEKYSDTVRIVDMGRYSIELCGGTHLSNTSQIGTFKIISETGVASGVRRIEAVTGRAALEYYRVLDRTIDDITKAVKAKRTDVVKRVDGLTADYKNLQKEISSLKSQIANQKASAAIEDSIEANNVKVLVKAFDNMDIGALKEMGDTFKDQLGEGVVFLASHTGGKVNLVCMSTKGANDKGVHCGKVISSSAKIVDGGGGGRPNMAQAGGKNPAKINEALEMAKRTILEQIG